MDWIHSKLGSVNAVETFTRDCASCADVFYLPNCIYLHRMGSAHILHWNLVLCGSFLHMPPSAISSLFIPLPLRSCRHLHPLFSPHFKLCMSCFSSFLPSFPDFSSSSPSSLSGVFLVLAILPPPQRCHCSSFSLIILRQLPPCLKLSHRALIHRACLVSPHPCVRYRGTSRYAPLLCASRRASCRLRRS